VKRARITGGAIAFLVAAVVSCSGSGDAEADSSDPMLLTRDLPFMYPPELYAARVEGDVELRLFVDSLGLVVPESTSIAEPSTHAEFDSSAVMGAPYLQFQPARSGTSRVGRTVVLPVKFRVPSDSTRRDSLKEKR
jgi:TonB family protein